MSTLTWKMYSQGMGSHLSEVLYNTKHKNLKYQLFLGHLYVVETFHVQTI